jgi:hypothetical protein
VPEPFDEIRPVIVRVRGAHDDLHVRIDGPKLLDGLEAVPSRRHAHVDERQRERFLLEQTLAGELHALAALQRKRQLEMRMQCPRRLDAEQNAFRRGHRIVFAQLVHEHLLEVPMDSRVVIDDQDASIHEIGGVAHVGEYVMCKLLGR